MHHKTIQCFRIRASNRENLLERQQLLSEAAQRSCPTIIDLQRWLIIEYSFTPSAGARPNRLDLEAYSSFIWTSWETRPCIIYKPPICRSVCLPPKVVAYPSRPSYQPSIRPKCLECFASNYRRPSGIRAVHISTPTRPLQKYCHSDTGLIMQSDHAPPTDAHARTHTNTHTHTRTHTSAPACAPQINRHKLVTVAKMKSIPINLPLRFL